MNFRMDGPTLERTVVSLHRIGPMRGQAPPTLDDMIRDSLFLRIPGGCRTRSGISMYPTPSLFFLPDLAIATLLLTQARVHRHKQVPYTSSPAEATLLRNAHQLLMARPIRVALGSGFSSPPVRATPESDVSSVLGL